MMKTKQSKLSVATACRSRVSWQNAGCSVKVWISDICNKYRVGYRIIHILNKNSLMWDYLHIHLLNLLDFSLRLLFFFLIKREISKSYRYFSINLKPSPQCKNDKKRTECLLQMKRGVQGPGRKKLPQLHSQGPRSFSPWDAWWNSEFSSLQR